MNREKLFILLSFFYVQYSFPKESNEVNLFIWDEYINPIVVDNFEKKHGANVNIKTFESDSDRDDYILKYGNREFDLILVDSQAAEHYVSLGWIKEIDKSSNNLTHVKLPKVKDIHTRGNACIPYFWGTTGIAFRKDLVIHPINSLKDIFLPSNHLKGKIMMPNRDEELFGMALKYLGHSFNSNLKSELNEAKSVILNQSKYVQEYYDEFDLSHESKLVTGEAYASISYNIDAYMLKERYETNIEYIIPDEGGAVWADFLCLSSGSANPTLAIKFLRFINTKEAAAENAIYTNGATPNLHAIGALPEKVIKNRDIYPNEESLVNSEMYNNVNLDTIEFRNQTLNEINFKATNED